MEFQNVRRAHNSDDCTITTATTIKCYQQIIVNFLNIVCKCASLFPQYSNEEARLQTFSDGQYPHNEPKPESLVDAGFFYKGFDDTTQCYMCAEMLTEWERSDLPWDEHQRLSPDCKHVFSKRFREGSLTENETRRIFGEAKRVFENLAQYCSEMFLPFNTALKLGHEKDFITYLLVMKCLNNGSTMPQITGKSMVKELVELRMSDDTTSFIMPGLYDTIQESIRIIDTVQYDHAPLKNGDIADGASSASSTTTRVTTKRSVSREEVKQLKDDNCRMIVKTLCRLCESARANVLALPCGHIGRCEDCWHKHDNEKNAHCPICAEGIRESIRVFHS